MAEDRGVQATKPGLLKRRPTPREVVAGLDALARAMDNRWKIPGLGIEVGWDAVLGLVPGVGDVLSILPSVALIWRLARAKPPKRLIAQMVLNIAIDVAAGTVPVAGDVFDVWFRANQRNLALARRWLAEEEGKAPTP